MRGVITPRRTGAEWGPLSHRSVRWLAVSGPGPSPPPWTFSALGGPEGVSSGFGEAGSGGFGASESTTIAETGPVRFGRGSIVRIWPGGRAAASRAVLAAAAARRDASGTRGQSATQWLGSPHSIHSPCRIATGGVRSWSPLGASAAGLRPVPFPEMPEVVGEGETSIRPAGEPGPPSAVPWARPK